MGDLISRFALHRAIKKSAPLLVIGDLNTMGWSEGKGKKPVVKVSEAAEFQQLKLLGKRADGQVYTVRVVGWNELTSAKQRAQYRKQYSVTHCFLRISTSKPIHSRDACR